MKRQYVFRLLFSGVIIALLFALFLNLDKLTEVLSGIKWRFFLLAYLITQTANICSIFRWKYILWTQSCPASAWELAKHYYLGRSADFLMPSAVTAGVVKGYQTGRAYGKDKVSIISLAMAEKAIALVSIVLISLFSIILFYNLFPPIILLTVLGIDAVIIFSIPLFRLIRSNTLKRALKGLELLAGKPFYAALGFSLVVSLLHTASMLSITRALDIGVSIWYIIGIVPVITLFSLVPFSFGGLGTREASLIFIFGMIGIAPEEAFSIAVLVYGINLADAGVGGMINLTM